MRPGTVAGEFAPGRVVNRNLHLARFDVCGYGDGELTAAAWVAVESFVQNDPFTGPEHDPCRGTLGSNINPYGRIRAFDFESQHCIDRRVLNYADSLVRHEELR